MEKHETYLPIEFRAKNHRAIPILIQEVRDYVADIELLLIRLDNQFDAYSVKYGHLKDK